MADSSSNPLARRPRTAGEELESAFNQGPASAGDLAARIEGALARHARFGEELNALGLEVEQLSGRPRGALWTPRALSFEPRLGVGLQPGAVPSPATPTAAPEQHATFDAGLMRQLTAEQLDGLPYGVVVLDARGRVVNYNDTESRMVGLPKEAVIGRSFFGDVAPCARVKEFEGRFLELVNGEAPIGLQTFEFVFHFARGSQRVVILITPGRNRGLYNVCMLRR